jgi:2-dehydropantoate 2-reductase
MRIVIFGTGGAGGYFGAQLARAGEDVVFIARGEHLNAIRTHGLRIEEPTGETVIQPAQATDDPSQVAGVDAIILGVKAWQVSAAAEAMRPMIGPEPSWFHCRMVSKRLRSWRTCWARSVCWEVYVERSAG